MRFYLVYNGPLPSAGNKSKPEAARNLRDQFHPQLEELWKVHRALKTLRQTAIVPLSQRLSVTRTPFQTDRDVDAYPAREDEVDLTAPIAENGKSYIPLVRKSLDLNCSLHIDFLRQEDPGELILQGGDLDGRIKTLFDALTIPKSELRERFPQAQDRTHCLLESDALVAHFEVATNRLLFPKTTHPNEVHLMIEVRVNVLRVGPWNMPLLGD